MREESLDPFVDGLLKTITVVVPIGALMIAAYSLRESRVKNAQAPERDASQNTAAFMLQTLRDQNSYMDRVNRALQGIENTVEEIRRDGEQIDKRTDRLQEAVDELRRTSDQTRALLTRIADKLLVG